MKEQRDPSPDWLEIGAHFAFGFVMGAVAGLFVAGRSHARWIDGYLAVLWTIGAGLVGGSISATLGNRLWYRRNPPLFGVKAPQHSKASLHAMKAIGIGGGLVLVVILVRRIAG